MTINLDLDFLFLQENTEANIENHSCSIINLSSVFFMSSIFSKRCSYENISCKSTASVRIMITLEQHVNCGFSNIYWKCITVRNMQSLNTDSGEVGHSAGTVAQVSVTVLKLIFCCEYLMGEQRTFHSHLLGPTGCV